VRRPARLRQRRREPRPEPGAATPSAVRRPGLALLVLSLGDFLVGLDGFAVSVALPDMQRDLGMSQSQLQWVVNAYTLVFGGFLLFGGRLGDLLGRRRIFISGLVLFAIASLLAGFASSPWWLVAGRAAQGLGAALIMPSALSIIPTLYADEAGRDRAIGVLSATASAGIPIGAMLGGLVTSALGWRWVLLCVVPFAVVAAVLAPIVVPRSRPPEVIRRVRVDAAVVGTLGLVLLVSAFVVLADGLGAWPYSLLLLFMATALLLVFLALERRSRSPLIDLGLFADPAVRAANLAGAVLPIALGAVLFLGTLTLQKTMGYSALAAGLSFVPMSAMLIVSSPLAVKLTVLHGRRKVALLGLVVQAAGLLALAVLPIDDLPLPVFLASSMLVGLGAPMSYVPLTRAAMTVERGATGSAAGLFNTVQQIGNGLSLGLVVTAAGLWTLHLLDGGATSRTDALADGYQVGFLVAAVLVLLAIAPVRRVPPWPR
jgi:MFS family permease